jgi:hypothetical protein
MRNTHKIVVRRFVVERPLGQTMSMRGWEDISCRSEVLQLIQDKDLIMVLNVRMS